MEKGISAIIKATNRCNLNCDYCIASNNLERRDMKKETLKKCIDKLVYFNGKDKTTKFIWHGGEPLILGLNFFRQIVKFQKPLIDSSYQIINNIQSNWTLLNEEFVDYFLENNFRMWFSLYGTEECHNKYRKYNDGRGSFDKSYSAIKLAKSKGIGSGAILVLSKQNLERLEEIYTFFRDEQINLKINPLIKSGKAKENESLSLLPNEYGNAMINLFDLWYNDSRGKIKIDPLDSIIKGFITGKINECSYSPDCQKSFIGIDSNGDLYPCGRFVGHSEFKYGNINNDFDFLFLSQLKGFNKRKESLSHCSDCDIKSYCNGGCAFESYISRGDIFHKTFFCESNKLLFNYIRRILERELIEILGV
mgnify:FL=1